jgi:16S rRNA (guanine1207-N2)-methyltransferase
MRNLVAEWYEDKKNVDEMHNWNAALKEWEQSVIEFFPSGARILDVGCGYGFMGITIAKIMNCHVDMIDVNKRALHLAKKNIENNKVDASAIESNIYVNVKDKYDVIITNPPIRAGKQVVLEILENAKEHLNIDGELWFVIRKDQGAKSIVKLFENSYFCEEVCKNKGFYIFKAKKR